jgi:hypothetical protein
MNYLIAKNNTTTTANTGQTNVPANTTTSSVVIPPITNPTGLTSVSGAVGKVINILLALIIIAAVIVIIISGFKMMTGGGSPDQLKSAKKGILWAVIGLVVAFMSFAIVAIIQNVLK